MIARPVSSGRLVFSGRIILALRCPPLLYLPFSSSLYLLFVCLFSGSFLFLLPSTGSLPSLSLGAMGRAMRQYWSLPFTFLPWSSVPAPFLSPSSSLPARRDHCHSLSVVGVVAARGVFPVPRIVCSFVCLGRRPFLSRPAVYRPSWLRWSRACSLVLDASHLPSSS
jgi:hypothetical protein